MKTTISTIRGLAGEQKRLSKGKRGKQHDYTLAEARADKRRMDKARRAARQEKGAWQA